MRHFFLGLVVLAVVATTGRAEPIELESRRELFVDRHLIDSLVGAELFLHQPHDEGPVFQFDQPWEGQFSAYVTVLYDGEKYRMYYRGMPEIVPGSRVPERTCYAESEDGVHWTRPTLNKVEFDGSTANNLLMANAPGLTHNFSPFIDSNPDADPKQKFKAICGIATTQLHGFVSPDGVNWTPIQEEPVFVDRKGGFDSQNVAFWSDSEQCYVCYYRRSHGGRRSMARTTSKDFLHWTEPVPMTYSNTESPTPRYQLYTNQTHAYFRAPHIYLSTAARFMPGRRVLTAEQAESIGVHPKYAGDAADAVLMTSRGGDLYDCTFDCGWVRPGTALGNWVSRTNYPALNIVPTGREEMSLYVNQEYGQPTSCIHRYSMRLDGFASVRSRKEPGVLVTKPITFTGTELSLNFATSAAGGIQVEIQDVDGNSIEGYSLADSVETIGNAIDRRVSWKEKGSDVSSLVGKPVRLKFVLSDADLYALQFVDAKGEDRLAGDH
ncbi:hypothetical protein [Blastopirellula marina]|uniref:hypothetical protein n=1 Tax=Blastopirellula marina TaxID=124 RepID=UPI001E34E6BC|nr:hypothetical protein [Blastopirellula marina]